MSIEKKQNLLRGVLALSSICKGEAFSGYIGMHGKFSRTPLGRQLNGKYYIAWLFPSELERQVQVLGDYVGCLEDVLNWNTLLPGLCRSLPRVVAQKLRLRHIGRTAGGMTSLIGFANMRSGVYGGPGICLQCLKDDISPAGLPFWRRDFLIRNVRFCARHETPIYEFCQICTLRFRRSLKLSVPQATCECGAPLKLREHGKTRDARDIELDMARGWSKFLDPEFLPYVQEPYITELIHEQAWERGLVSHVGVNWPRFYDLISPAAHKYVATSIHLPYQGKTIAHALRGEHTPRNPFHTLFLLIALFGSWNAVESALQSQHYSGISPPISPYKFKNWPSETRTLHKQRVLREARYAKSLALLPQTSRLYETLQSANPHLSHTQLRLMLPTLNNLAATRERLKSHGVTTIPTRQGHLYKRELDIALTAHIEQRRAELLATDERIRISRSLLVNGHNTKVKRDYVDEHLPMAAAALRKYVETPLTWRRRVVGSAIRAGKLRNWSPDDADRVDVLSFHELDLLLCRIRRHERT
ncbi:hypothetical protein [Burkholderia ubonensis]|uniref:hypothetical protein n=1 Tax=Burkholderia ubonensis TaxID=101571 RepID=UPI001160CEBD|nr:hypothetical protein [Burkholderia ubonensis]